MAAYYDRAEWTREVAGLSGHLIADTREELESFAARLNLPQNLYQIQALLPHYQLPQTSHEDAAALGAIFLERRPFMAMVARITDAWFAAKRPARTAPTPAKNRRPTKTRRKQTDDATPTTATQATLF